MESVRLMIILGAIAVVVLIAAVGIVKRRQLARQMPELGDVDDLYSDSDDEKALPVKRVEPNEFQASPLQKRQFKKQFKWQQHPDSKPYTSDPLLDEIPSRSPRLPEIITFNVLPQDDESFSGYELLQAILASGLRYGDMKIFHRYQEKNDHSSVLFSLASATEPGTFDIDDMSANPCRGLTLFMQTSKLADPQAAYDLMLETAQQLADDLDAQVFDGKKQIVREAAIA